MEPMTEATSFLEVAAARTILAHARAELDLAVAELPELAGDEAVATPRVLALLVGAVRAKEHLDELETSFRASA